jgi:ubiquitin carboxyl-terminal hydrolase 7
MGMGTQPPPNQPQINDRYEFYDEIDLDRGDGPYLSPEARKALAEGGSPANTYKLHSVLVHSGGVHGGHYYA